jgi:hypothetical protein
MLRPIGATCLLLIAGNFSSAQAASGKPPFVQITTLDNITYIFDVTKVQAVTTEPHYVGGSAGPTGVVPPHAEGKATHIWGMAERQMPVAEKTPHDFLTKYNLDKTFFEIHGVPFEAHLNANAVTLIEPHRLYPTELEPCKGKTDGSSCTIENPQGPMNGMCHKVPISNQIGCMSKPFNTDVSIGVNMWSTTDEPDVVKQQVDKIRAQPEP